MIGKNEQRLIPTSHLLRMRHYLSVLLFQCSQHVNYINTLGLVINEESRRYIVTDVGLFIPECVHKAPSHAKQGASDELHTALIEFNGENKTALELIDKYCNTQVDLYETLVNAGVALK